VHLDLSGNGIDRKGCKELFKALENNFYITSLLLGNYDSLNKNRLGEATLPYLSSMLENNSVL
jgi:hypothetical protein